MLQLAAITVCYFFCPVAWGIELAFVFTGCGDDIANILLTLEANVQAAVEILGKLKKI